MIQEIINRKKQGIDCTEQELEEVKMWIKDTLYAINRWEIETFIDVSTLFPAEYKDVIDEMDIREEEYDPPRLRYRDDGGCDA